MANDGTVKIGTELDDSGFKSGLSKLGSVASGALKGAASIIGGVAAAATGAVAGLLALESATEEYRIAQGKLNTAFEAAGYGPETASEAYTRFYEILGDTDTATEASQLLAKLAESEEDVATWADIAAGVSGTFGDSLPIEGLIEASNETAKVGQVTGVLADALNWAGISEDEFNAKLSECTSESERNQLIMDTLAGTYDEASAAFYRNNEALIASRDAQAQMDESLALLGEAVSDIKNRVTADFLPAISQITEGLAGMLSGVDGAGQQLTDGFSSFIESATAALPQFLELGVGILQAIIEGIIQNLPLLLESAGQILTSISNAIIELLPQLLTASIQIITQIANGISENLPQIIPAAVAIIGDLITALLDNIPLLVEAALEIIVALAEGLIAAIPELIAAIPKIIDSLINAIIDSIPLIIEAGIKLLTALVENLPEIIDAIIEAIPKIIDSIVDAIIELIPLIIECGVDLFLALIENLPQIIKTLVSKMPEIIVALVKALGEGVKSFISIGADLVKGLWQGIKDAWAWLKESVSNLASSLFDAVKSIFGISSPSKKFKWIGEMIGEGFAKGIDEKHKKVKDSIERMSAIDYINLNAPKIQNSVKSLAPAENAINMFILKNTPQEKGIVFNINFENVPSKEEAVNVGKQIGREAHREMRRRGIVIA